MRTDESNEEDSSAARGGSAPRSAWRRGMGLAAAVLAALLAASCGGGSDDTPYEAEIRRTSLGVPFIEADNWQGLGYGVGYARPVYDGVREDRVSFDLRVAWGE